jgi:hypothetical protein
MFRCAQDGIGTALQLRVLPDKLGRPVRLAAGSDDDLHTIDGVAT